MVCEHTRRTQSTDRYRSVDKSVYIRSPVELNCGDSPSYWLRRIRCSECPHTVHMSCRGLYPDPEAFIYPYMSRTVLWMSRTVSRQSQGKNVVILQFSTCYRSQTVTPTVTYGRYIIIHVPNCNMVLYDGCIVPYCADTVRDPHPPDVQITVHFQI